MDRRTSLISTAAIAAVLLAGGTAVAANIGVLGAASDDSIGQLTAAGEVGSTVDPSTSTSTSTVEATDTSGVVTIARDASADTQGFLVEDAGTVTVRRIGGGIELGDVAASAGWSWSPEATSPSELTVTFTSSNAVYVFTAQVAADGAISARVDQVIVQQAPDVARPATATPSASFDGSERDDDHDDEQDDEQDDEHEDEEHEEHEGGEDDD